MSLLPAAVCFGGHKDNVQQHLSGKQEIRNVMVAESNSYNDDDNNNNNSNKKMTYG